MKCPPKDSCIQVLVLKLAVFRSNSPRKQLDPEGSGTD